MTPKGLFLRHTGKQYGESHGRVNYYSSLKQVRRRESSNVHDRKDWNGDEQELEEGRQGFPESLTKKRGASKGRAGRGGTLGSRDSKRQDGKECKRMKREGVRNKVSKHLCRGALQFEFPARLPACHFDCETCRNAGREREREREDSWLLSHLLLRVIGIVHRSESFGTRFLAEIIHFSTGCQKFSRNVSTGRVKVSRKLIASDRLQVERSKYRLHTKRLRLSPRGSHSSYIGMSLEAGWFLPAIKNKQTHKQKRKNPKQKQHVFKIGHQSPPPPLCCYMISAH